MYITSKLLGLLGIINCVKPVFSSVHVHYPRHGGLVIRDEQQEDGMMHFTHSEYPDHRIRAKQPDICDAENVEQWSGYLDLPNGRHMFFWFFESRVEASETLLWLNGGPGCSSLIGEAMEMGPCKINNDDGLGLRDNPYGWNANSSLLFLDQPAGVGFSHAGPNDEGVWDGQTAARDVYTFLQIWFDAFKKDFENHILHISGESYAGRYIPLIAAYTMEQNEADNQRPKVPLKSVLIGNGLTSPLDMYGSYYDAACTDKSGYGPVVNETGCNQMEEAWPTCEEMLQNCAQNESNGTLCENAVNFCENSLYGPYYQTGLNPYDMTKTGDYPEDAWIDEYFSLEKVRTSLGVDPNITQFVSCSDPVYYQFSSSGDQGKSSVDEVVELLDKYGLPVLIYSGEADFICNWLSNERWTLSMDWKHHDEFNDQELKPWYAPVDGKVEQAGVFRSYDMLTFATVAGAGHYVPYGQPEVSLAMVMGWIHDGPSVFTDRFSKQ